MPTTGEQTPVEWTAEYERAGRIEFPLRRAGFAARSLVILVPLLPFIYLTVRGFADDSLIPRLTGALGLVGLVLAAGAVAYQVITRRPYPIVDAADGIELGRRTIPWPAFAMAQLPTGRRGFRFLTLVPVLGQAKEIRVSHATIQDLEAFSCWLNELPSRPIDHVRPYADPR